MAILSAENNFKKGLLAIVDENFEEAARCFRRAIDIQEQRSAGRPDWRYLSYYGLSLAKATRPSEEAIAACRSAAANHPTNLDLVLNLARVYRIAGKYDRAAEAVAHGLRVRPDHPSLLEESRLLRVAMASPSAVGFPRDWSRRRTA